MRSSQIGELVCPVARAIAVVGDPWTLLIVRELFLGEHKFDGLQAQLRASPALLTQRLKDLTAEGIVSKRAYQDSPRRFSYHLTTKGLDLWPLLIALKHWGDRWGGWKGNVPADLVHLKCGGTTGMKLVCECCDEPLTPFDTELRQRGAMRKQRLKLAEDMRQTSVAKAEARTASRRVAQQ